MKKTSKKSATPMVLELPDFKLSLTLFAARKVTSIQVIENFVDIHFGEGVSGYHRAQCGGAESAKKVHAETTKALNEFLSVNRNVEVNPQSPITTLLAEVLSSPEFAEIKTKFMPLLGEVAKRIGQQ